VSLIAGVIAAGAGLRLTRGRPGVVKPLVPVAGRPLSHWVVAGLGSAGAGSITVLTNGRGGGLPPSLSAAFPGISFDFMTADTGSSYESFVLVCRRLAGRADAFLVSCVDAVADPGDVSRFWERCRASRPDAGLALTARLDDDAPLWADVDAAGRVTALGEDARRRRLATCGLYYMTRGLAERLPEPPAHARLRDYWRALVASGARVRGAVLAEAFDVDRPEDVAAVEERLRLGPLA